MELSLPPFKIGYFLAFITILHCFGITDLSEGLIKAMDTLPNVCTNAHTQIILHLVSRGCGDNSNASISELSCTHILSGP